MALQWRMAGSIGGIGDQALELRAFAHGPGKERDRIRRWNDYVPSSSNQIMYIPCSIFRLESNSRSVITTRFVVLFSFFLS